MKMNDVSFVRFLGYKRKHKLIDPELLFFKRKCVPISENNTEHTAVSVNDEMEIENNNDSLFVQLPNGDYTLINGNIPKNNSIILPTNLKDEEQDDAFKNWRYNNFRIYFRDYFNATYYEMPK